MFFPEKGQSGLVVQAQMMCLGCPVRGECEDYQRRTDSRYGVWAGEAGKGEH